MLIQTSKTLLWTQRTLGMNIFPAKSSTKRKHILCWITQVVKYNETTENILENHAKAGNSFLQNV